MLYATNLRAARARRFERHTLAARDLATRFERDQTPQTLDVAVSAARAAIADVPDDEPRRWVTWSDLSNVLRLRYELLGHDGDLDESASAARRALALTAPGAAAVPGQHVP